MIIDRLGGINPLENVQNTSKPQRVKTPEKPDSVSVSSEAKGLSEMYFAMEAVTSAPDVRADRVAEVAEKIKDPGYITGTIVDIVADRFLDEMGI